jgi:hypothetical protein
MKAVLLVKIHVDTVERPAGKLSGADSHDYSLTGLVCANRAS